MDEYSVQYDISQQILSGPLLWSVLSSPGVDWKEFINLSSSNFLTLLARTSQDGQTCSNNSSDVTDELFEHFVGFKFKGLKSL